MEYGSAAQLLKDLRSEKFLPIYVLHGTEPFFIDQVASWIEDNVLNESERAFNLSVLYGRDIDAKQVMDHARQFPLMSKHRVVMIKEAQFMRDLKSLDTYFSNPAEQTILVIAHKKKIDGRIKWMKSAKNAPNTGLLLSDTIPEYKMSAWLSQHLSQSKIKMSPQAIEMLVQYLGNDLKKMTNEVEKIRLNVEEGQEIDTALIERYVGISREYDIYALLKAMSQGDLGRVHEITYNIVANEKNQPLQMIIPGMASYFEKVMIVAQNKRKDDRSLGSMIGTYPSFVREYRSMSGRFDFHGLSKVYDLLVEADGYSKGLDRRNAKGIFQELIGKILLCQSN